MEPTPFHHASLQGASSQAALVLYSPVQTQMQPTLPPFAETLGTSMDECVCVCGGGVFPTSQADVGGSSREGLCIFTGCHVWGICLAW